MKKSAFYFTLKAGKLTKKINYERQVLQIFSFLWALIVGGTIGTIAGAILGKDVLDGITGSIIMGSLGSWVTLLLLPSLGSVIGGLPIVSALLGAIVCIAIYFLIVNRKT